MPEEKKTFVCPFCGILYKRLIPAGSVHLRCSYCGATFFVPTQLGGRVHYCLNNPENQAIGLCDNCKGEYCDQCLHVSTSTSLLKAKRKLYLCSSCLKKHKTRKVMKDIALGTLLISIALFLSPYTSLLPPISEWQAILIAFVFGTGFMGLFISAYGFMSFFLHEPTIHEEKNP